MLYKKRKMFDKLSRKLGFLLSKFQLSANQWTISSLLLMIVTFYFLISRNFLISTILLAFTAAIDMIDGAVARATKKATIFGAYLDTIIDRIIEFVAILGLIIIGYPDFILPINIWLTLLLFSCLMITYSKAAAFEKGLTRKELKGGILEHPDRMLFFILIVLISNYSLIHASFLIAVMTILTITTAIQRFLIAIRGKV